MAKTEKLIRLRKQYESACNEYIKKFCNKQGLDFDGWIGDIVGGIACCNIVGRIACCDDFYFYFHDIVLDINTKQPKGAIIEWYYGNIDAGESINYFSFRKGLRVSV